MFFFWGNLPNVTNDSGDDNKIFSKLLVFLKLQQIINLGFAYSLFSFFWWVIINFSGDTKANQRANEG